VIALSVVAVPLTKKLWLIFLAYGFSGYVMWGMGHRVRPILPEE